MSLVIRSVAGEPFSDEAVCRAGAGVPPRRVGPSHLHKRCHGILFAGRLAGVRGWGGQAGGCAARRQGVCVGAPLSGRWGKGGWGAFEESAEESAAGSEIQPYLGGAGVGCGRLGDRSPTRDVRGCGQDSAEDASMDPLADLMTALTLRFARVNFRNHECRRSHR